MSLNNYMPPENRKRQKVYMHLELCFNLFLNNNVLHKNKIRKYINPTTEPQKLFVEYKTRISMPKFGKFFWRILQHGK